MLKLSNVLDTWTPGEHAESRTLDPVVLLGASWAEIVGAEVARNSHPSQITDDALVVTTRSSAWSQQLSFLGETIVRSIQARLPSAGITRLRFRVGRIVAQSSPLRVRRAADRARSLPRNDAEGSATPQEALARFRSSVEGAERAKRGAGWKECGSCRALIGPESGPFCRSCDVARTDERVRLVSRLLFEAPWLGFTGTAALVTGLQPAEYAEIRDRLVSRWWTMLQRVLFAKRGAHYGTERLIASSYVLLKSGCAPEHVTPAVVRNVLGDELYELLYGSERLDT